MSLVVRTVSSHLERLGAWAARFKPAEEEGGTAFYEADLTEDELQQLCRELDLTCDLDSTGMGELQDASGRVARVRPFGRML